MPIIVTEREIPEPTIDNLLVVERYNGFVTPPNRLPVGTYYAQYNEFKKTNWQDLAVSLAPSMSKLLGVGGRLTATLPLTVDSSTPQNISTTMNTKRLVGRGSVGVGAMEEIIIGTNLSLDGNTLNASGYTNNTHNVIIDCGAFLTPNENILIDCGNFI